MIEEGQERKCTPYIPATFGPSPVFGMDGMPRGATGYPPQGPPGPGGYPGYGPPHGAQAPPQQNYNQQNNWNGPHGPIHPVRHPFQGVCYSSNNFQNKHYSSFRDFNKVSISKIFLKIRLLSFKILLLITSRSNLL